MDANKACWRVRSMRFLSRGCSRCSQTTLNFRWYCGCTLATPSCCILSGHIPRRWLPWCIFMESRVTRAGIPISPSSSGRRPQLCGSPKSRSNFWVQTGPAFKWLFVVLLPPQRWTRHGWNYPGSGAQHCHCRWNWKTRRRADLRDRFSGDWPAFPGPLRRPWRRFDDAWLEGLEAFWGVTVAGFPNLFFWSARTAGWDTAPLSLWLRPKCTMLCSV